MDEKTHPCDGCIYCGRIYDLHCCNYIFVEDKMRGCPPGEGCTKKITDRDHYNERKKELARKARRRAEEYMEKRQAVRLRIVTCPICGTAFRTSDSRKKFCGEKCYNIHRHRVWVERARARREKQKQTPTGDANK